MEKDVALPATQVLSSLGGEGGKPEAVPMEIVEVSTLPDEAFVVEVLEN